MVSELGKVIVIVFAALSLILIPVSLYYVADTSGSEPDFSLVFHGRFYDAKIGDYIDNPGFNFFKFTSTGENIFNPSAWNDAFSSELVLGMPAGTLMMILWYVSMGVLLIGIIVAFFRVKISGIFFLLAFIADGLQALFWYLAMNQFYSSDPNVLFFPIPITALFLLATAIIAFTSKKKESYYYSPGYSYGYGRR